MTYRYIPYAKRTLPCGACGKETTHALAQDANSEGSTMRICRTCGLYIYDVSGSSFLTEEQIDALPLIEEGAFVDSADPQGVPDS